MFASPIIFYKVCIRMFQSLRTLGHLSQFPKQPKLPLLYFVRHKPFPARIRVPFTRSPPITDCYAISHYTTPNLSFSQAMDGLRAYSLVDIDEHVMLRLHLDLYGSKKKKKQVVQAFTSMVLFPHRLSDSATIFVICQPYEVESVRACGATGYLDTNSLAELGEEVVEEHEFFLSTVAAYDQIRPLLGRLLKGKMPNRRKGNVVEVGELSEMVKKFHSTVTLNCQKFPVDRTKGFIDVDIGKLSFSDDYLLENLDAVLDKVREYNTPELEKFVFKVTLSTEYAPIFSLSEGLYLRVNSAIADSTGLV